LLLVLLSLLLLLSVFLGISSFDHSTEIREDQDLFEDQDLLGSKREDLEANASRGGSSGVILRQAGCLRRPPIPCQLSAVTLWDRPSPLLRVKRLPGLASFEAGCSLAGVVGLFRGASLDDEVPASPRRRWEPYNPEPEPTGSSS
jgi:hypothetical protein